MINYSEVSKGDILKIVGIGAQGYANYGDLVRVLEKGVNFIRVENESGKTATFRHSCGAERLESTKWKKDFPEGSYYGK